MRTLEKNMNHNRPQSLIKIDHFATLEFAIAVGITSVPSRNTIAYGKNIYFDRLPERVTRPRTCTPSAAALQEPIQSLIKNKGGIQKEICRKRFEPLENVTF